MSIQIRVISWSKDRSRVEVAIREDAEISTRHLVKQKDSGLFRDFYGNLYDLDLGKRVHHETK